MTYYDGLEKYNQNIALITEGRSVSYQNLIVATQKIQVALPKRSLVFNVCKNNYESVAGYLAFLRSGMVQVLIQDTIDKELFSKLCNTYRPEYIYLPSEKSELVEKGIQTETIESYRLLKTSYSIDYTFHPDLALLMPTSGSTGSPKLVRQSYQNLNSNAEAIVQYLNIQPSDRPISTLPMAYTYMLSILNSHLLKGATIILTEASMMDKVFWTTFKDHGATTFGGVPYTYEILKKLRFEKMELPTLKYLTQAGGALSPILHQEMVKICSNKGIPFIVMYGQTEATARIAYLPWENAHKIGSIGIAIPGGKLSIDDETQELIYEGANVSMGYAESYHDLIKADENKGILRTGDLAKKDDEGFYYITGRKKRFLKMYGKRVNLDELEGLAREAGFDCACTGTDDHLKIFMTNEELKDKIRTFLSKKTGLNPHGINMIFIEKIPRNDAGKILYSVLENEGSQDV